MADGDVVKVTADLTPALMDSLKRLAARRGVSANTVLQQAIVTEDLLASAVGQGDRVVIKKPNYTEQELVFTDASKPPAAA